MENATMSATKTMQKKIVLPLDDDWAEWRKIHPQKSIKDVLSELRDIITHYEQKYKMTTAEFLPRYEDGEFEMDDRYADYELAHWQGSFEAYQRLIQMEK